MPEVVVEPAVLQALARPLTEVGSSLAAVLSSGVLVAGAAVGDPELSDALEEFGRAWRHGLAALAESAEAAGTSLASVATGYNAVEALVADWSGR